ncbi:GLPGLI family protein [Zunongwangia sp. SCSIO 43204]|uniref:GLPGLI family protein n=1 Tax=Zunongwangia sp. SCSIO 43204 TaxID=2779359 RepID=UPI001CAA3EB1|nr:GLPGLI family protein [Zunongwangia sp. SCSIO 43204]UAB85778.1 GLPGLI family protein [Zunongwangia sp. SCSIO 43204]
MSNKIIFILGVLAFNFFQLQAQNELNYRVSYKLTYKLDSTNLESSKSEIMWLFANNESSLFLSRGAALKNSMSVNVSVADIGSERWKSRIAASKTDFKYKICKNKSENKLGYGIKLMDDKLYYSEDIDKIQWEIQTEAKEIAGYQVQKATTSFAGRDYIAWFTPEIPLSDGPYKFAGLPGLIVEIRDTEDEYNFEFTGFEELDNPLEYQIVPKGFKEVKKKELLDLLSTYLKDPISYINNYVGASGTTVSIKIVGDDKRII